MCIRDRVNTVIAIKEGEINTCDVPFSDDFEQFYGDYLQLTKTVRDTGTAYNLGDDYMVIGTSALAGFEIDGAVNIYAGIYNNPFLIWGKYRKKRFRFSLPISFQSVSYTHLKARMIDRINFLTNNETAKGGFDKLPEEAKAAIEKVASQIK